MVTQLSSNKKFRKVERFDPILFSRAAPSSHWAGNFMRHFAAITAIRSILSTTERASLVFIHLNQLTSPDKTSRANVVAGYQLASGNKHLISDVTILGKPLI